MTTSRTQRLVDLPGPSPIRIDANIVVCLRVEMTEHGSFIVIHTNEGFSFAASPLPDQSTNDFYEEVHKTIWPPKTSRTTKRS